MDSIIRGTKRPRLPNNATSTTTTESIDPNIFLLNKTWIIRSISPFTVPFVKLLLADDDNEFLSQDVLYKRQLHMSHFLRQRYITATAATNKNNNRSTGAFSIPDDDRSETYVSLSWLLLPSSMDTTNPGNSSCTTSKRTNCNRRSNNSSSHHPHHHIYVQVTVDDQLVSFLLLCYPTYTNNHTDLQSFSYLLHRGNCQVLSIIYSYFETTLGCRISPNVFHPSSSNVMSSMAQWSVLSFLLLQQQQQQQQDISKKGTATKPFEVTFQTPSHIQEQGLSTITITIPPASLERLNNSIAEHLQKQQQQQQQHSQVSADGTNPYNDGTLPTTTLPTLRAIQYFMYDCFHFDITSFPLTRVSCNDIGIIGCDGRIKLFSLTFVDTILKGIQDMVVERYGDANDLE